MNKELKINIKAMDNFSAPFKKMRGHFNQLETSKAKLNAALGHTQALKKLTTAGGRLKTTIGKNETAMAELTARIKAKATAAQARRMEALTTKIADNRRKLLANRREMRGTTNALRAMGHSTRNVSDLQSTLRKQLSETNQKLSRQKRIAEKYTKFARKTTFASFSAVGRGFKYASAATVLSPIALFGQLKDYSAHADNILKTAQRLKLNVTAFQAYRHAAELAGARGEDFDKSLEGMSKRMGELQAGTGSLYTLLNKADQPMLAQLKAVKDNGEAFEIFAERIKSIKDPQKQAALANAAFGRSGVKMLLLLRQGSAGLLEARKAFNALGGGVSEAEARGAAKFNDAMTRIKRVFEGIKSQALAPVITELTEKMQGFLASLNTDDGQKQLRAITARLQRFAALAMDMGKVVLALGKGFVAFADSMGGIRGLFNKLLWGFAMLKIAIFGIGIALRANPLGLLVTMVQAAIAGFFAFRKEITAAFKWVIDFGKKVSGVFAGIACLYSAFI